MTGDTVSWKEFHQEWAGLQATLKERDERIADILEEVRDSLGAMHTRFDTLPCDAHKIGLAALAKDMVGVQARALDWRAALTAINRKSIAAVATFLAAAFGWQRGVDLLDKWGK